MAIDIPSLDDRDFDDLFTESINLISKYLPDWTDRNPSDPGITLIELFSFLFENIFYRINRIPEKNLEYFAELVGVARKDGESIEELLKRANEELKSVQRAISLEDYELLARKAAAEEISRVKVLVETSSSKNIFPAGQSIRIIIVPNKQGKTPRPNNVLCSKVYKFLRKNSLITSRVRVSGPVYTRVEIDIAVVLKSDFSFNREKALIKIEQSISKFLDPLSGGINGEGWEFGRSLFASELYDIVESIPEVDYVNKLILNGDENLNRVELKTFNSLLELDQLNISFQSP